MVNVLLDILPADATSLPPAGIPWWFPAGGTLPSDSVPSNVFRVAYDQESRVRLAITHRDPALRRIVVPPPMSRPGANVRTSDLDWLADFEVAYSRVPKLRLRLWVSRKLRDDLDKTFDGEFISPYEDVDVIRRSLWPVVLNRGRLHVSW